MTEFGSVLLESLALGDIRRPLKGCCASPRAQSPAPKEPGEPRARPLGPSVTDWQARAGAASSWRRRLGLVPEPGAEWQPAYE